MFKLPEPLHSWAWTSEHIAKANSDGLQQTESGLLLPGAIAVDTTPAYCHFSQIQMGGKEISWLWLFLIPSQAIALRLLPEVSAADDPFIDLVDATVPRDGTDLVQVDLRYLARQPMEELGIHQVWMGFNWKNYYRDRNLRAAADYIFSADEFCQLARR